MVIQNAITKCKKRGNQGVSSGDIIKHVRSENPHMKHKKQTKGVYRALERMVKCGHLWQSSKGRYFITPKERSITHKRARFDIRVCKPKQRCESGQKSDQHTNEKKSKSSKRSQRRPSTPKRRHTKRKRGSPKKKQRISKRR